MFLHLRAATEDFVRIVMEECPGVPGVVHSFTGSAEELQQVLGINPHLCIGINGCSLKTEENLDVLKLASTLRAALQPPFPLDSSFCCRYRWTG